MKTLTAKSAQPAHAAQKMQEAQLIAACEAMNAYEAANPDFAAEGQEWVDAKLTEDDEDDDFDPVEFERGWEEAKALRESSKAAA